jgi:hypothetical protein
MIRLPRNAPRPSNAKRSGRIWRKFAGCQSGATVVEFALVGGLFLGLILGVIEVGRLLWTLNALHYGAQQAARCAAVNSTLCGSNSLLQAWAAGIGGSTLPGSAFSLNTAAACGMQVTASYSMQLYIPYVNMNPTLTATACFPKSS